MARVTIEAELSGRFPELYLAERVVEVEVRPSRNLGEHVEKLREQMPYKLETLKDEPVARAFRDFYWRIGIDPTKKRPAGEALARRILSGSGIPSINNLVDAGNLASAETLIPIGIYDLDKVVGELVLRFAREGEEFVDIRGKKSLLKPNEVVLVDDVGVIHIFPHRDSQRTMITMETRKALILGCGVKGVPKELVEEACDKVIHYLKLL